MARAAEYFHELINRVQTSGLHYKIEMSPFSTKVFMKTSFTKDMNGNPVKTLFSNESTIEKIKAENKFLNSRVFQRENTSNSLASQSEQTLHGYQQVYQTNVNLIQKVENLQAKLSASEKENLKLKLIKQINTKKDNDQLEDILFNKNPMEEVDRLGSELSVSKVNTKKDVEDVQKRAKQEIKAWKKELGDERRIKLNLEKKIKLFIDENESVKERLCCTVQTPLMQIQCFQTMLLKRKLSVQFVQNPFTITNLHSLLVLR